MRPEQRAAATPLVGTTLANAYRIVRLMGEGAMGGIYEARQLRLDKRVAIKVLARELAANGEALLAFHREAEITSSLGHPHIITVFDFGSTDGGQPFLVMEYLEGEDLANRLHRASQAADAAAIAHHQAGRVGARRDARQGASSTATSSPRTCSCRARQGERLRQGARLRHLEGARRQHLADERVDADGHADVHGRPSRRRARASWTTGPISGRSPASPTRC